MIRRSAKLTLGTLLLILGVILTPMPIPLGIVFILVGLSLLVSVLPALKHQLINMRRRYPRWSAQLQHSRRYLPHFARRLLDDTDPEQQL
ncbi:hypothetical protein CHH28_17175 [Bacterioplanes sanyensis]|uniref:Uncharacterized protein n=1 Tax=Bacterioplanes sanyensis TaxID=1249553 RepID=A0A222FNN2_9GAMM|nr:hypothetical protein [Bacterioplanes sanyensis]ASP40302.1 hypothetical protein CHH28_17175 [Bacterioplanes sanyensis]